MCLPSLNPLIRLIVCREKWKKLIKKRGERREKRISGGVRGLCRLGKGPRIGGGHGEAEESEADFRKGSGNVGHSDWN